MMLKNKMPRMLSGILIMAVFMLFSGSCKKEKNKLDGNGNPPVISNVTDLLNRSVILNAAVFGDWILIKGKNLGTTTKVEFNNVAAADSLVYADDSTVTVKIPLSLPDPLNNPIKVTTKYGTALFNFQILQPAPLINSFNPIAGPEGTLVTLSGDYFLGVSSVKLNATELSIVSKTTTEIVVKIPAGTTGGFFFVTTPSGTSKAATSFGLSYVIYDDVLATGWSNTSYSTTAVVNNTVNVLRGSNSIKTNYTVGFGGFRVSKASPAISLTDYKSVKFSVFGATNSGGYKIRIIINGVTTTTYFVTLPTTLGVWTQYEVPFTSLGNPTTLSSLELKEWSGKVFEVYFDDIGLL